MLLSGSVAAELLDPQGLLPSLQWQTRRQFKRLAKRFEKETQLRLEIRSGRRTCAEQASLYASGRTRGGAIVTHAQGCRSWHTLGRAVDAFVVLPNGRHSTNQADYEYAGRLWENEFDGVWGGDFPGFGPGGDAGHFEYHPGLKTADVCPVPTDCESAVRKWGQEASPWGAAIAVGLGVGVGVSAALYWNWRNS